MPAVLQGGADPAAVLVGGVGDAAAGIAARPGGSGRAPDLEEPASDEPIGPPRPAGEIDALPEVDDQEDEEVEEAEFDEAMPADDDDPTPRRAAAPAASRRRKRQTAMFVFTCSASSPTSSAHSSSG